MPEEQIELGPITRQQLEIRLQDIAQEVTKQTEEIVKAINDLSENLGKWIASKG
jgi:hypothetical protein